MAGVDLIDMLWGQTGSWSCDKWMVKGGGEEVIDWEILVVIYLYIVDRMVSLTIWSKCHSYMTHLKAVGQTSAGLPSLNVTLTWPTWRLSGRPLQGSQVWMSLLHDPPEGCLADLCRAPKSQCHSYMTYLKAAWQTSAGLPNLNVTLTWPTWRLSGRPLQGSQVWMTLLHDPPESFLTDLCRTPKSKSLTWPTWRLPTELWQGPQQDLKNQAKTHLL